MNSDFQAGATSRAAFDALLSDELVKGGRVAANWMADGRFWFVEGAPEDTAIQAFDPKTSKIEPLFDVAKVRAALAKAIGREPPYRGLPFAAFAPTPDGGAAFSFEGADYVLNAAHDQVTRQPTPNGMDLMTGMGVKPRTTPGSFVRPSYFTAGAPAPEMMSPDGRWFVGIDDNNLYLRSTADGRRIALTTDGEPDCSWDVESLRMRLAPGLALTFTTVSPWSPDGMKLFATRFDERGGSEVHHLNWLKRHDEVVRSTWILAGEKLPVVEPYIVSVMGRRALRIQIDPTDRFLLPIGWTPDGAHILLALYARDMSSAEVVLADASTGEARVLLSERSDTFLRIQHDIVMGRSGCTLLPDGSGFLWLSDRDGYQHIFQYDLEGELTAQLTKGDWAVRDVLAVDPAKGEVWFLAYHEARRPYDAHLCRAPLGGGKVERLTEGEGVHEVQIAPGFGCFVDTVSTPGTAPQSTVRDASGKALHVFPPADLSALEAAGWSPPEQFCVKAADGETDLWGVLYRPRDFDPSRSYPVLEYVYGGPQVSVAPHFFQPPSSGMRGLVSALPQLGYVTVVLDARGTPERSKAFQDATYKDWRRHLTADHAAALKNLGKDRPWMDLGRVGVWGFSWGGYTTLACLLDAPELYRAGVSSSPGYDPYSSFLYEPYLGGVPEAHNKTAYDDALLIGDVGKLQGKLMIVAGTNDVGVWHDVVKMSNALIEARKDHELVMMPGQGHGYGALHEAYYIDKLVGHFGRHVKDAEAA